MLIVYIKKNKFEFQYFGNMNEKLNSSSLSPSMEFILKKYLTKVSFVHHNNNNNINDNDDLNNNKKNMLKEDDGYCLSPITPGKVV